MIGIYTHVRWLPYMVLIQIVRTEERVGPRSACGNSRNAMNTGKLEHTRTRKQFGTDTRDCGNKRSRRQTPIFCIFTARRLQMSNGFCSLCLHAHNVTRAVWPRLLASCMQQSNANTSTHDVTRHILSYMQDSKLIKS